MAVIDTSMDIPKSCMNCRYCDSRDEFVHSLCTLTGVFFPTLDYYDCRHKDCPLKSTDEMIAEIEETLNVFLVHEDTKQTILSIIDECCNKENTDGK